MLNMSQGKYTTVQYKHENVSSAQLFHKNTVFKKEYKYSNVFGWKIALSYVHYLYNFSWK